MDIIDMKKAYGITDDDYRGVFERLYVLRFSHDRRGDKVVSQIDGDIVFIHRSWAGDRPGPGETWLCRVTHPGTAYLAEPLINIQSSFMDFITDEQRRGVIDAVLEKNRSLFEGEFERRHGGSATAAEMERLRSEHRDEVDSLRAKIASLEAQLDWGHTTMDGDPDDGMGISEASECVHQSACKLDRCLIRDRFEKTRPMRYNVERVGPNLLRSESFEDGRYFVHITPNGRHILVRPCRDGPVIAVNNCLHLRDFDRFVPFMDTGSLYAEYSERYDGMIIDL